MEAYWRAEVAGKTYAIYHGDARELLPELQADVILTDPVWPNADPRLPGSDDPYGLFASVAVHFARFRRVIVHLGCDSDPRILAAVPTGLPFLRACWLRYTPPTRFNGTLMAGADVAYVFGEGYLPGTRPGQRVLPGEFTSSSRGQRDPGNDHPCHRNPGHVEWLVAQYTRPGDVILDPFVGSGTTLIAALKGGRSAIGIEIERRFCDLAVLRMEREMAQLRLALS
ncbi:MAG: site-specific DNA-methyltransferase [Bacillota bacterium]|nr:site-specific DNA-methyltransferase [Bacillota bacterium]